MITLEFLSPFSPAQLPLVLEFAGTPVPGDIAIAGGAFFVGGNFSVAVVPLGVATTTFDASFSVSEMPQQFVAFNVVSAVAEYPQINVIGEDLFNTTAEWPIFFTSAELLQPKLFGVDGVDLFTQSGFPYLGESTIRFGGCGFSFGDSFSNKPSYWDDEQSTVKFTFGDVRGPDLNSIGAFSIPWPVNYVRPEQDVVLLLTGGDTVGSPAVDRLPTKQQHSATGNISVAAGFGHARNGFTAINPEVAQLGNATVYYDEFRRFGLTHYECPIIGEESGQLCLPGTPGTFYYASYPIDPPPEARIPEFELAQGYRPVFTVEAWVDVSTGVSGGVFSIRSTYDGSHAVASIFCEVIKSGVGQSHTRSMHVRVHLSATEGGSPAAFDIVVDVPNAVADAGSVHLSVCSESGVIYTSVAGQVTQTTMPFDYFVRVPHASEDTASGGVHTVAPVVTPFVGSQPYQYSGFTIYELRFTRRHALYKQDFTPQKNLGTTI